MQNLLVRAALVVCVSSAVAHAEAIQFNGVLFVVPDLGSPWDQEWAKGTKPGEVKLVSDTVGDAPELMIALVVPKSPGTVAQLEATLQAEVVRPGVTFFTGAPKTIVPGKATTETIAGATVRHGAATVDGQPAGFAIVDAGTTGRVILVGVAREGKEERALSNFTKIVKGLKMYPKMPPREPDPEPVDDDGPPALAPFVAVREVKATSTFVDKSKKDMYGAWRTLVYEEGLNGIPKTAWCEGKPDEGIGEGITITFAGPTKLDALEIAAGVWLTPKLFTANNEVTSLAIAFDKAAPIKVAPKGRKWLKVKVGKAVSTVTITIDAVKKGKMNDSCISGIQLIQGERREPLLGFDGAAIAALPAAYKAIWNALHDDKRAGLDKLVAYPFSYDDSTWFYEGDGNEAKVTHKDWKSIEKACKSKARKGCPSGPNVSSRDDQPTAGVAGRDGRINLEFPSSRETIDTWSLVWRGGAWKLDDIGYTTAGGPDY